MTRGRGRAAAAVVALVLAAGLAGCGGDHDFVPGPNPAPGPGPAQVDVDTPDLRALKEEAGIEPCRPGPGGGGLPAVTVPCLGGGASVDLSTLRGPMLINVWQSACDECRVEMPVLQEFHQSYADQVPIIGLDFVDVFPGSALELAQDGGVTYPLLADPGGELQGERDFPRIPGYPDTIFLDADGEVAYTKIGVISSVEDLLDLVREHLGVIL
jgi:thiol-disulfide isomerase/thioredoxin